MGTLSAQGGAHRASPLMERSRPQRILTHAYSRVILRVLEAAVAAKKRFSVYITESQPDLSGQVPLPGSRARSVHRGGLWAGSHRKEPGQAPTCSIPRCLPAGAGESHVSHCGPGLDLTVR